MSLYYQQKFKSLRFRTGFQNETHGMSKAKRFNKNENKVARKNYG